MNLSNLRIISAGAGSGKTYRLTQELVDLLQKDQVRAEGIIATTFTRKAAAELQERVRVQLLKKGLNRQSAALNNALIGTVHGLGVKLLQRFAYEAGVSPDVSIIAEEDQQILFNQSLSTVLTEERVLRMNELCRRLGLNNDFFDWRSDLRLLTEVARANGFGAEVLQISKTRSAESFLAFLDPVSDRSAEDWNQELAAQIAQAITAIQDGEDGTKITQNALGTLRRLQRELTLQNELAWPDWARLGKLKTGAKSRDAVAPLLDFAAGHDQHPNFRQDIADFIDHIFELALAAIQEYDAYKKQRGLIDYTDMEVLINQLLNQPPVQEVLRAELDLLLVDEFQDTSPIQLSIFLKLSRYAQQSIWVGDPKQSIYGFRGAAPELMQAIVNAIGGVKPGDILGYSWRSREDLVYTCNALFTKAFSDLPQEQVALVPQRTKAAGKGPLNQKAEPIDLDDALIHWHLDYDPGDSNRKKQPGKPWLENALADQLRQWLDHPPLILPKGEKTYRRARPGDVAILCRSNKACQEMAEALHRAGLAVAISRSGLLSTAEAKLILAALKFLLNEYDSLSIAELLLLGGQQSIEVILQDRLAYLAEKAAGHTPGRWSADHPLLQNLNGLRHRTADLSATEIVEMVLDELDLHRIIATWGNSAQRLDNVDQLRRMARQYEEACNRLHAAASLGGFLLWLSEQEKSGQDKQGAGERPEAVNVLTYHRSKGLEWPIVICHSLDQKLRAEVWGMDLVSDSEQVDLNDILAKRWIRYWVNPYDRQYRNTPLEERIDASAAKQRKVVQARQEEARLLYVGLTRARDYLVIPTSSGQPTRWLNRVWHQGDEDIPTLDPDTPDCPWDWQGKPLIKHNQTTTYPKEFTGRTPSVGSLFYFPEPPGATPDQQVPFLIDERQHKEEALTKALTCQIEPPIRYTSAITLDETIAPKWLGKVIKALHTAWHEDYPKFVQKDIVGHYLRQYELEHAIAPDTLLDRQKAFRHFLEETFQPLREKRKYPVIHPRGARQFRNVLDLILENDQEVILIQHSAFPGPDKKLGSHASSLGLFFHLSREALQEIYFSKPIRTYVHFVFAGCLIKVKTHETNPAI